MNVKQLLPILAALAVSFQGCNQQGVKTGMKGEDMKSQIDSISYLIGYNIGENIKAQGIDDLKPEILASAIADVMKDNPSPLDMTAGQMVIERYMMEKQNQEMKKRESKGVENLAKGEKFLEENKTKPGVITTESGLQYEILTEGNGESPKETDIVETHYTGTLIDGKVFDSSVQRGQPVRFPVNGVIPGWTEALLLMKPGAKWKLYLPSRLAYGERGAGNDIGPNEVLIFEVELLSVESGE